METLPQPAMELKVEQPATGRWEDMGTPTEVDAGSTAVMKGDHVVGLKAECKPGSTWADHPR
jgi:N-acetylneuraminic acid mutarotase